MAERRGGWTPGVAEAVLAVAGAAALSLAVRPGADLWASLAAEPGLLVQGSAGAWTWRWLHGAAGLPGLYALRVLLVASALALSWPRGGSRTGWDRAKGLAWAAAFALLAPWGRELFLPIFVAIIVRFGGAGEGRENGGDGAPAHLVPEVPAGSVIPGLPLQRATEPESRGMALAPDPQDPPSPVSLRCGPRDDGGQGLATVSSSNGTGSGSGSGSGDGRTGVSAPQEMARTGVSAGLVVAFAAAFLWPLFECSWLPGTLAAVLMARGTGWRRGLLLGLAPVANPVGALAIWNLDAFLPFAAAWVQHPAYAPATPASPAFWLLLLAAAALLRAGWGGDRTLLAAGVSSLLGMLLRPLAALPPLLAAGTGAGRPPWAVLLVPPLLAWLLLARGPAGAPGPPIEVLSATAGARTGTVLVEPAWRDEAACKLAAGGTAGKPARWAVLPAMRTGALLAFRSRFPSGLAPPWETEPEPGADAVLLRAGFPRFPWEGALRPGWALVSAGSGFALFMKGPSEGLPLKAYSPYRPLAKDPAGREAALAEALRLLRGDPGFFQALRDAGRLETDLGRLPEAEAHLEKAARARPRDAEVWNDLGATRQMRGNAEGAKAAYEMSLELDPSALLPALNLAALEAGSGQAGKAEAILRGLLERPSANYPAHRLLIQLLLAQGRGAEARAVAQGIPPEARTTQEEALAGGR